MTTKLEYSIASQANKTKGQVEQYSRFFSAQATGSLGKELSIAILAEEIGSGHGDQAARIAVTSISDYFHSHVTVDVVEAMTVAIGEANAAIIARQKEDPALAGHGASVTIAVVAADRLFIGGVGQERVYMVRDDQVRAITLGQNWVSQAIESWGASAEDIQDFDVTVRDYLGKSPHVQPQFAPIDFFWESDVVILVTAAIANLLQPEVVRDLVFGRPLDESAKDLVELAIERGGTGNLTAIVIRVPGKNHVPLPVPGEANGSRISPAVKGLIVGNALLLLLVAAMLLRSGGIHALIAPSPTVELAKPAFLPTPTLLPAQALDAPGEDPFAPTPVSPAGAPTLAPAPTFTPMPLPPDWKQPGAPMPLQPANGTVFGGADAAVVLGWEPLSNLPGDMFYVVAIRKYVNGKLIGESRNWTRSTRIRLDSSFYTAQKDSSGHVGAGAPTIAVQVAQFQWSVAIYRLTQIQPDGILSGQPVSPSSPLMTFLWGPQAAPAPTRVYGSENLTTDPFFRAEEQRQASADATLTPISAGMAGIWLILGGLIAAPKFSRQWKHANRGTRS